MKETKRSIQNNASIVLHFCESLNRTISEILMKKVYDNKTFGKTIELPFLSDKVTSTNKMTLTDKEDIFVGDYNTK